MCLIGFLYYVRLFLFWCWVCKSNSILECFCQRVCGMWNLCSFGKCILIGSKKNLPIFVLTDLLLGELNRKMFLCRFLFVIIFGDAGSQNSAFLCIRNLRGTVHSMVQFLRKFPQTIIKTIIVFPLTSEVALKWVGVVRVYLYMFFYKTQ